MSDDAPPPAHLSCPHCLAANDQAAERCTACGKPLVLVIFEENPYAPPRVPNGPHTFHIGSLMLLIALIAVCLSLLVTIPGVGVLGILVLTPALIRTIHGAWRGQGDGRPMDWNDRLMLFLASIGVVLAIEIGMVVAFTATCFPIGLALFQSNSPWGLFVALGLGITAAAVAGFYLIRRLWPRRTRHAPARPHIPGDDPEFVS